MENPEAAKHVSMAFLTGKRVFRHDPYGVLDAALEAWSVKGRPEKEAGALFLFIDHAAEDLSKACLVLRPQTLCVGIGCNSGTSEKELVSAVSKVFSAHRLSPLSIRGFATISDKLAEPGLCAMAASLGKSLKGFTRNQLSAIDTVPNPSAMVKKHMGVESVCEAAAIRAAKNGPLLVPKKKIGNATVAVAALPSMSWESDPAARPTCPAGPLM
jgi:cobalt-precorrin 5A hydrolase